MTGVREAGFGAGAVAGRIMHCVRQCWWSSVVPLWAQACACRRRELKPVWFDRAHSSCVQEPAVARHPASMWKRLGVRACRGEVEADGGGFFDDVGAGLKQAPSEHGEIDAGARCLSSGRLRHAHLGNGACEAIFPYPEQHSHSVGKHQAIHHAFRFKCLPVHL